MKKIIIILLFSLITNLYTSVLLDFPHYNCRLYGTAEALLVEKNDFHNIDIFPASIADMEGHTLSINYLQWQDLLEIQRLGYAFYTKWGVFGLTVNMGSMKEINNYDDVGNLSGALNSKEYMVNIGYGNEILWDLKMGINIKYLNMDLGGYNSTWWGGGLSLLRSFTIKGINVRKKNNFNLGAGIQNVNIVQTEFDSQKESFPISLYGGFTWQFYDLRNIFTAKWGNNYTLLTRYKNHYLSTGLELSYRDIIFLRGGYYIIGRDEDKINVGLGLGKDNLIRMGFLGNTGIKLDYGLSLQDQETSQFLQISLFILPFRKYRRDDVKYYKAENIIIDEEEHSILFSIKDDTVPFMDEEKNNITREGNQILKNISELMKKEDYKRVTTFTYTTNKDIQFIENVQKKIDAINDNLLKNGIKKDRLTFKIYDTDKKFIDGYQYKVLMERWKEEEKEEFEHHFYMGLDASIKELHDDAIEEWEKALSIDPDHIEVKTRLELEKAKKQLNLKNLLRSDLVDGRQIQRVAIFDFENTSRNKDFEYLSQTIPESITITLVKQNNFIVVDRRIIKNRIGSLELKDSYLKSQDTIKKLGELWNVDTLITGSYIYNNQELRINIYLIDVRTGEIMISDQIKGNVDKHLFLLLDRTSQYILKKIKSANK
ncbi:MAG: hypothetical protein JW827_04090 [Spirochaetes bacterium]|nr:hypothetical protein [Spirochaetota bacterium]